MSTFLKTSASSGNEGRSRHQIQSQKRISFFFFFPTFPDEIVVKIFSFLPNLGDRLGSLRNVNRQFRRLCGDRVTEIDSQMKPHLFPFHPLRLKLFLPHLPHLRWLNLRISADSRMEVVAVTALRECPRLEGLAIALSSNISSNSSDLFNAVEKHGKSLRRFHLTDAPYLDPTSFGKLTHIELYWCYGGLNEEVLLAIASECVGLESLQCSGNGIVIGDETMRTFLQTVKGTLKTLDWSIDSRKHSWLGYLGECQKLERMAIERTAQRHLKTILDIAERLPSLKCLGLGTTYSTDADVPYVNTTEMSVKITDLWLRYRILGDDVSLTRFVKAFRFPGLLQLKLCGLRSKEELWCLAEWCGETLKEIFLEWGWDDVLIGLVKAARLPRLKRVRLWSSRNIPEKNFSAEMKSLGVEVVYYRGTLSPLDMFY